MSKANKGRIGGDVLADIKKWTKNKPELQKAIKKHQEKHYAKIAKRNIKEKAVFVPPGITYEKAIKNIEKNAAANKKLYKSSGRGHWNKKAVEIMNKCMENNSEQQIIIKNASKKLTKEILKTGIGKQVQLKEHAPLGNVPIAPMIPKDHLKKCTNILIDGMVKEGAKKMRKLIRATNYKTGQIINLPTINEREAEIGNAPKGTIHNPCSSIAEACETIGNKDGAVVFVKSGVLTPKKKRIPTRFNAKKLKEKHAGLWNAIEKLVYIDIDMLTEIYNGRRNIDEKKARTIAHNAAFTAIVEMIKRGLL